MENNRAQIKMSFGMIFSIILIIVFLVFAFYAIRTFMNIQNTAQVGIFLDDLQSDITSAWNSPESAEEREYSLPLKIKYVCFVDFNAPATGTNAGLFSELRRAYYGSENMVFYPVGSSGMESTKIRNIAIGTITGSENPFCIKVAKEKIKLTLVKNYDDDGLVRITR